MAVHQGHQRLARLHLAARFGAAGTDAARCRRRNAGVRELQLGLGQRRLGLGHLGRRRLGLGAIHAHVLDAGLDALGTGLAVGVIRLGLAPGRHRSLRFIAGDAALLGQSHQPLGIGPGAGQFTAGRLLFGDRHPLGGAGGAEGGARLGAHRLGFAAHLLQIGTGPIEPHASIPIIQQNQRLAGLHLLVVVNKHPHNRARHPAGNLGETAL